MAEKSAVELSISIDFIDNSFYLHLAPEETVYLGEYEDLGDVMYHLRRYIKSIIKEAKKPGSL